jgi:hypothetical protein
MISDAPVNIVFEKAKAVAPVSTLALNASRQRSNYKKGHAAAFPMQALIKLNKKVRDKSKDKSIQMRRTLVADLTVATALRTLVPRKVGNAIIQSHYTMADLKYDVNSTVIDVVMPVVTPVANKVIYDWEPPEPLPPPEEATFDTDGTSCVDSMWFDDDTIREIGHLADVDPLQQRDPIVFQVEFGDETTQYEVVEDLTPHSISGQCNGVTNKKCGHDMCAYPCPRPRFPYVATAKCADWTATVRKMPVSNQYLANTRHLTNASAGDSTNYRQGKSWQIRF